MEVGILLEEWLEDDENLNLWEHGKLTESDKRVLITKFVGSAWEKIFSRSDFSADIYFQRTGCLLTLDGSDDHLVNIEGLKDYKPPFVQLNDAENIEEVPEPAEEPTSDVESEDDLQLEVEEMAPGIERNFDNVIKL